MLEKKKVETFLKVLFAEYYKLIYVPIDTSKPTLNTLETALKKEFYNLDIEIKYEEYFGVLEDIFTKKPQKVIMFLGSNLGRKSYS
ncbi:L-histidine N(alpha)-methyltransferase [Polaribacter sp. IC073]|uniref:L-histidine N(alpha)-methyltransferase n=1 Tax=Polaribacter sp. IC073 TaxID=2508540 RepID=UPI0011BE2469|nr:L-histidine N(alpha)-methyltransferase [Polaribacter sp. IC073]TXD49443.1 L-histidine N(alpha)-methyltransferase [Polaribacter sp. IC073]